MTNEEAISGLLTIDGWGEREHEAIAMAIKALEQPEPCEDAVSRQAVLDMIDTYMNKSIELHYLPTSDGIKKLISILPSAQPAQSEMIKDIRKWINSGNRGNADYFIVDKIEEIINLYEIN